MGSSLSNNNCIGNVNEIYEPSKYVNIKVNSSSNNNIRSQNSMNTPIYNSDCQPFSRKPSIVRFVETINKDLKVCNICENLDNISIVQYNQCIECGLYHCGFHKNNYHESNK